MIIALLLVLLILDSFVLVAGILLQAGKGTGMAATFGGVSSSPDAFIGTRQAGNLLTKITWWSGGIFLAIAFVLQVASARTRAPKSILEQGLTPPPAAPLPTPSSSSAPALPFLPGQATPAPAAAGNKPSGAGGAPASPAPVTTKPTAPAAPAPGPK